MDITLNIYFDKNGINYLNNTNQIVGIIRSYPGNADLKYICIAFEAFINNNQFVFSDDWQALAGRTQPQNMKVYNGNVSTSAEYGKRYSVSNAGFEGAEDCPADFLGIENISGSVLYPGIAQKINDDYGVCNVGSAGVNTIVYFGYSDELWIFTASGIASNMAISTSFFVPSNTNAKAMSNFVTSKYLSLNFQDDTDVYFDSTTNLFKVGKLP